YSDICRVVDTPNEYVATPLSPDELNTIHCNIGPLGLPQNEDPTPSGFVEASEVAKTPRAEEDSDDDPEPAVQHCKTILNTNVENSEIATVCQVDPLSNPEPRVQDRPTDGENSEIATVCQVDPLSNPEPRVQDRQTIPTDGEKSEIATVSQVNPLSNSEPRVQ